MSTFMSSLISAREIPTISNPRYSTGIQALDEVFTSAGKAGLEKGVYILGGDPGTGKSTFALHVMHNLASRGHIAVYCAYEGRDNIFGCIKRMNLPPIISVVDRGNPGWEPQADALCRSMRTYREQYPNGLPLVMCIDSIKNLDDGSIADRKRAIKALHDTVHDTKTILFVIGHATKESQGKKVKKLEGPSELVGQSDVMMYFVDATEAANKNQGFRNITLDMSNKNRFGPTAVVPGFRLGERGFTWPYRRAIQAQLGL